MKNSDRFYPINDVKMSYPSVTTILKIIANPGLMKWFINNTKEETEKISETALDLGTRVHDWIECHIKINLGDVLAYPKVEDDMRPCLDAFFSWEKKYNVEYLESELAIHSHDYQFAGKFDILAKVNGELSLIDIKTSKAFYNTMGLQLSAYCKAWEEMNPDNDRIQKLYILRLDKITGKPHFKEYKYDLTTFFHALQLWKWQNNWNEEKAVKKYKEQTNGL